MSDTTYKFQVDQKIVYPSQGVGKIMEITQKKFKDKELLYYVIYLDVSDMTIMVPVDKVDELGIRAIVSAGEAQKAIDMMGEEVEPVTSDWKLLTASETAPPTFRAGFKCSERTSASSSARRAKRRRLST